MLSHEFCFLGKAGILNLHEKWKTRHSTFHVVLSEQRYCYKASVFLDISSQSQFFMRWLSSWSKSFCIEFKLFCRLCRQMWKVADRLPHLSQFPQNFPIFALPHEYVPLHRGITLRHAFMSYSFIHYKSNICIQY